MPAYKYTGFSGLLNMGVGDFGKPANELSSCKNIQEDEVGVLKRVPGTSKADSHQLNAGIVNVNFLSSYYQNSTGTTYMLGGSGSGTGYKLQYRTTGAWTALTGGTYASRFDAELSAVNYLDRLFIVGYDATDAVYLPPATILGTTHSTSDVNIVITSPGTGQMPGGKYVVEYNDLLYVLNTYIGSTKAPSSAYYCNDPVNGAITWNNTLNFLEFGQQDGDEITGGAKSNDRLVVFKNNSMWTWDETNKKKIGNIGCDSYKSIQEVNSILYWYNRNGIWRWDGAIPQLISGKVQPFIDAIDQSKLNKIVAVQNGLEYRMFIGTVTVRGITYTNCWIVFDVRREKFYIRCTKTNALSACEYVESNTGIKRSYFGSDTGYVYKFNQYIDGVNSDDGDDIDYFFVTNTVDLGEPEVEKLIGTVHFYTLNANGLKYLVDSDKSGEFNEGVPGQIAGGNVYDNEVTATGHRFAFKFFGKDQGTPMEFEGIVINADLKEDK